MTKQRGELTKLGSLFEKYERLLVPPQASVEKEIIRVIADVCGRTLTREQVVYTVATKSAYLRAPSLLKSEILRFRAEILERLASELAGRGPIDLR